MLENHVENYELMDENENRPPHRPMREGGCWKAAVDPDPTRVPRGRMVSIHNSLLTRLREEEPTQIEQNPNLASVTAARPVLELWTLPLYLTLPHSQD